MDVGGYTPDACSGQNCDITAQGEFTVYGPSHWAVLVVFAAGAVALVWLGRRQTESQARLFGRIVGAVTAALYAAAFVSALFPPDLRWSVPLHLTDLATVVTAYALWSQKHWAFVLTYYWGLVLSVQALISPVFTGPDFPNYQFLGFWSIHLLVVWAAIYLTWGRGMRPDWRSYRFAVAVTVAWVAVTVTFNSVAGSNYGFLNAKPGHSVIAGRDGAVAVVRAGGGGAGGCGVGGDDVAVGTDAPISDRRRRARVVGVLVGQLSDAHTVAEPVQYATGTTRGDGARRPRVDATAGGNICRAMPHSRLRRRRDRQTWRRTAQRVGGERHLILNDWRRRRGGMSLRGY